MKLKQRIALFFARREVLKRLIGWAESSLGRPLTKGESKMFNSIFGNWRTTLVGLVGAIGQAWLSGMGGKAMLAALPTLLLGVLAKDSHVGSKAGQ